MLSKILTILFLLYTFHITHYTDVALCASKGAAPVAHWRFDEGGGPTAYDDAGANDGTLQPGDDTGSNDTVGEMWTRQGKIGGALECDGTNDYVVISSNAMISETEGTISLWAKFSAISKDQILIISGASDADGESSKDKIFIMLRSSDNKIISGWQTATEPDFATSSDALTTNIWYHLVLRWSLTLNQVRLFVNSVEQTSGDVFTGDNKNNWVNELRIGKSMTSGAQVNAMDGYIDDVRIYNYARTADQILVDYNAGFAVHAGAGTDPNEGNPPVAYWKFDENAGITAYDRSGNGNDGTLGGDGIGTDVPTWRQGKNGPALSFDGGDYVDCGNNESLDISENFTLEFWVYLRSNGANIFDKGGYTNTWDLVQYPGLGNGLNLRSSGFSVIDHYDSNTVDYNKWTHIIWTYDSTAGSNNLRLYKNGSLRKTWTETGGLYVNTTTLKIGTGANLGVYLNGLIDDVKIYNYARTAAQIAYDYNKGKPVAHYKFDEGAGSIVHNEYSTAGKGAAPVGWWRMDNNWNDSSGYGNNGTASGGATFSTSAKIGPYCGSFNGTDAYIATSSMPSSLTGNPDFTIEYWANLQDPNMKWWIVAFGVNSTNNAYHVGVSQTSAPYTWYIGYWNKGINTGVSVTLGSWQHVAVIKSGTAQSLYINGILVYSGGLNGASPNISSGVIQISKQIGYAEYAKGLIDDVRIYNYARTAEQIYNDYKTTHGTLVGDTKFVDGKTGKALEFDGNGDYVDCGNDASLYPYYFTIEAWVQFYAIPPAQASPVIAGCDSPTLRSWSFYQLNANTLRFWIKAGATIKDTTFTPTLGQWYHLAGTADGAYVRIYINGSDVGAPVSYSGHAIPYINVITTIGRNLNYPGYFNGLIDDVRIYNYARTAEQILQDCTQGATRLGAQAAGEKDPWGGALPVAHWKLDENTGVLARDASGNGNDGTLGGDGAGTDVPSWTQGKNGPALSFDGTDDYVDCGDSATLDTLTNFTISLWYKPVQTGGYLIQKGTTPARSYFLGFTNADRGIYITLSSDGSTQTHYAYQNSNPNIALGEWNHIVFVKDGISKADVYVNTKKITFDVTSGSIPATLYNGDNLYIGKSLDGRLLKGVIDDIKIYNYARTPAQIAWDYNRGKPIGHWRFNEATTGSAVGANTIKDDSGRGYQGTGAGTNLAWTTGKFGGGLSFNGTDDWVSFGQVLSADKTLPFTMSAWAKPSAGGMSTWRTIVGTNTSYAEIAFSSGNLAAFGQNAGGGWFQTGTSISADTWYHIVGVYDGTNARLYVNGVLVSGPTARTFTNNHGTTLMGRYSSGGGEWMNGLIDDVRIYNYARTAEQILQDYNNGAATRLGD